MPVAMASGEATILPCIAGACRDSVALLWLTCEENKWQRQTWTHQEVWQRACGAAQRLGRGRCGVAVDEGPLLPLLELAVLLAGGSIVPLDPCEPKGRLASVLEDSAPDQVVAKDAAGLANVELALEQVQGARPALILAEHLFADGPAACTEAPAIAGDAISHVFFTSGSTGKPKGCVVAHCALRSYCLAKNATYKLGAESVCLVASAHTFDPSLGDFMSTWAAGGCVALGPRSDFLQNLGPLLENSQATHLLCTPSLFATLGPRYEPSVLPSLRSVALGGEKMPPQMVKAYGVTECCVYNATRQMLQDDSPAWLGNPLPGNVLLLQDTSRDELTDAEEGELAIAGAQVGEGYLKRPELTARQFQVHPEHGRLYLSGDLVRRSEGELQLLGRKDHQVKVRGHRIELTEVEHWLLQFAQPLVNSLAVTCIEDRLVAFCVPSPALSTTAVRRVLRAVLRFFSEKQVPRAMRPRFAWCDSLPLTGSGKVARHELSQLPVQEDSEDEEEERAPLQGLELRVAQIWAEELAQPLHRINKHSHFQELGGHSISALRVCRRLAVHLSSGEMSRDDDALGGDLGELTGPFAPLELLTRPKFQRYVQFLAEALGQDVDMAAEGQEEAEDEEGDGVELLHRAAAAGSVLLIGFLVGQGIPVDGHCSRKRLKATPIWVVTGGAGKGGIIVREGEELSSDILDRLEYGAVVQEELLVHGRLKFRKLYGEGPERGWISTRLHGKDLAVPAMPPPFAEPVTGEKASLTFYCISDVHVELKDNMEWLRHLPRFEDAALIVAGDLGVSLMQVKHALELFKEKFEHVFYCFGNHEAWCHKSAGDEELGKDVVDSFDKLERLRAVCSQLEVFTSAQLLHGVWVVPVFGWYHKSWDTEPPLQVPRGQELAHVPLPGEKFATDTAACKWRGMANASVELAGLLDKQNELWGSWPLPVELIENLRKPRADRAPVISFSHFLPRLELMPEKRFLFTPNLTQIVGSDFIRDRVMQLQPDLHIFGHSHFPWDMTLDNVRYKSWPLGTPAEQARRIASYPSEEVEKWYPLPVFDSLGRQYPSSPACWYSLMYTRIKREPGSCHMADFVADVYCPKAPRVPPAILSPGFAVPLSNKEHLERRERYEGKSSASMRREMKNWASAS
ncbi:unnamed protein product [Effrenium voratum]|nr:unnamed protein product [Effrenium voratum]